MQSRNTVYIERLDHLRFFAAAAVALFHATLFTRELRQDGGFRLWLIDEGHVGVQLFMVISGFILAVISQGKELDAWRFYWNRILRIYPLFVFVVALGYFSKSQEGPASVVWRFLVALSPISNLARQEYGEFGPQSWSVAVELQFYLLFPLFHARLMQAGPRFHLGIIALLIVLRAAVYVLHDTVHMFAYLTLFGELDVFLVGHLTGWLYMRGKLDLRSPWWFAGAFALLNVVVWLFFREGHFFHVPPNGVTGENHNWLWILYLDVLAVIFAVLVVSYLQCAWRLPGGSVWAALGRYSYSIYMWHLLVIWLYMKLGLGGLPRYGSGLIVLAATIALSWASYHLIELPFLAKRVGYTKPARVDANPPV